MTDLHQDVDRTIFERYAEIQGKISVLEDERDSMKANIAAAVFNLNPKDEKVVVTGVGTFENRARRKYKYSSSTEELAASIKDLKEREEQDGTATYTENKYVQFKKEVQ